jgi:hypothetical protein
MSFFFNLHSKIINTQKKPYLPYPFLKNQKIEIRFLCKLTLLYESCMILFIYIN